MTYKISHKRLLLPSISRLAVRLMEASLYIKPNELIKRRLNAALSEKLDANHVGQLHYLRGSMRQSRDQGSWSRYTFASGTY